MARAKPKEKSKRAGLNREKKERFFLEIRSDIYASIHPFPRFGPIRYLPAPLGFFLWLSARHVHKISHLGQMLFTSNR